MSLLISVALCLYLLLPLSLSVRLNSFCRHGLCIPLHAHTFHYFLGLLVLLHVMSSARWWLMSSFTQAFCCVWCMYGRAVSVALEHDYLLSCICCYLCQPCRRKDVR
jgi:hypothetical protein